MIDLQAGQAVEKMGSTVGTAADEAISLIDLQAGQTVEKMGSTVGTAADEAI